MDFLDLTLMFRVKVDINENLGSYVVTKAMLNHIDKKENDLLAACKENNAMPYEIIPLFQKVMGMMGDDLPEEFAISDEMDNGIYFVGNKESMYGGGYLINDVIFEEIADRIGTNILYIIPSSIHELLVANGNIVSENELANMIQDVNATQVAPEEVLSDHPYKFVRNRGFVF